MISKKLILKPHTTDDDYTKMCNLLDKQGILKACGSCDDKWMIITFANKIDYLAWLVTMGLAWIEV